MRTAVLAALALASGAWAADAKAVLLKLGEDARARENARLTPSKVPLLLKSFSMRFEFADTACGRQPVGVEIEGEGVAIFVETKFRSHTLLDKHARATTPDSGRR